MMLNLKVLLFLLVTIGLDEAYKSVIVQAGLCQPKMIQAAVSGVLFGSQILFAPLQAGFSDFSCRRRGLLFALIITFISLVMMFWQWAFFAVVLLLAALVKGVAGNVVPIARAALADTIKHNFRFAIGLSTSAIAIGYIFTTEMTRCLSNTAFIIILVVSLVALYVLGKLFFFDRRDLDKETKPATLWQGTKTELRLLYTNFLCDRIFLLSCLAYFFWELSFYLTFIKDVELENGFFENFSFTMCVGYLLGVILLRFTRKSDPHVLRWGYTLAVVSLLTIFVSFFVTLGLFADYAPLIAYFFYSLGFGFIVPCLFSMVSKIREPHEQGKIYGLIDSFDTVAFTIAILLDVFVMPFRVIIFLSFVFLLVGVFVYTLSRKHWKVHEEKISK